MPGVDSQANTSIWGLIVQNSPVGEGIHINPAAFTNLGTRTFKDKDTPIKTSRNYPVTQGRECPASLN